MSAELRSIAERPRAANAPAIPAPSFAFRTLLSARSAFLLNSAFVFGLVLLSQLPLLDDRPLVRASMLGAAGVLLAWSVLLFGVLRRGEKVKLEWCCSASIIYKRFSRAR